MVLHFKGKPDTVSLKTKKEIPVEICKKPVTAKFAVLVKRALEHETVPVSGARHARDDPGTTSI